jgi:hypothetical protein
VTRPAETGGALGTIGLLIAYIFGVTDAQTVAIIGAGVGLFPSVVTFLVANGGIRGVASKLWVGNSKTLVKPPKELKG